MPRLTCPRGARATALALALGIPILTTPSAVAATPRLLDLVNLAPVSTADAYTTPYQTTLLVGAPGVLGNDLDPDGDSLEARLVTGPAHGDLTLAANGGFRYQPDGGFSGIDSFSYGAFDGSEQSLLPASVSIVVGPAPIPSPTPVATPAPTATPTPSPTPTPAPSPTATPKPSPTPATTATPKPSPTAAPSVPLPPAATPEPTSATTAAPTNGPTATPAPSGSLEPPTQPSSAPPEPGASTDAGPVRPTGDPGVGIVVGGSGGPTPPDPSLVEGSLPLFREPDMAPVSFSSAGDLAMNMEWVIPTFLITVPGFLMIGVGLAQVFGGFVWLPLARRLLSGDGRRPTKKRGRDPVGLSLRGRRG